MADLIYLVDEICSGIEIYFSGRAGGQYWKTAFILCDDYTELTSKLFLLADDPSWSDKKPNGSFKTYSNVLADVLAVVSSKQSATNAAAVKKLQQQMSSRRGRRNDFFHSTHLLDLSLSARGCVEAFCDLLDYGQLLFGQGWADAVKATRNMETMEILLRLEARAFSDPAIPAAVNEILSAWPRNRKNPRLKVRT